ncbi:MAG: hypothetical protein JXB38_16250 [Anaerolineales bacterium]|nr:hypothetical protein [Anaerolineales bacterium]
MAANGLPIPEFFKPDKVGEVWRVPYEERAIQARTWATQHQLVPTHQDTYKLSLFLVDVQNTFCIPNFELFVGGRSGMAAVEDNVRLCEFIYHNLNHITSITATLDTHQAMQIFHAVFLIDADGNHPAPYTLVTLEDIKSSRWKFNPDIAAALGTTPEEGQKHLEYYVKQLAERGKFDLTIWPYHAMLGGISHALVSAVEEAVFFHGIARQAQVDYQIKGYSPFTEHYSALSPEVAQDRHGKPLGRRVERLMELLTESDAVAIAGQAKSHCVAATIEDLLSDIQGRNPELAKKVYLLEDCTSPVVVPGAMDYTPQADAAFARFAEAGMHLVKTTVAITDWPGI